MPEKSGPKVSVFPSHAEQAMKMLIAPLNWGLGHATRCIPLIKRFLNEGHEVFLGGDGMSLELLKKHFPELPFYELPSLNIRYSASGSQVTSMLLQFPKLVAHSLADYGYLKKLLRTEHFDRIVSDNRFGFRNKQTYCIYITHQLTIKMPQKLRWAEKLIRSIHYRLIEKYDRCWIPDRITNDLGGELSHPDRLPGNAEYIGILSRFDHPELPRQAKQSNLTVALLSGPEPQRTLFETAILERFQENRQPLLLIQGKIHPENHNPTATSPNIRIVPEMDDRELCLNLLSAGKIIARSGYSTIMDLATLGVLHKAELIPTPGQTEQEYLAQYVKAGS